MQCTGTARIGVQAGWPAANSSRVAIQSQLGSSTLVPVFNLVLERVYWSVRIWVPGEVPGLFSGLLGQSG